MTNAKCPESTFVQRKIPPVKEFKIIAFTHRNTPLEEVGRYHADPEIRESVLQNLRNALNIKELMYLSTCNRVEFLLVSDESLDQKFLAKFFKSFKPEWSNAEIVESATRAITFEGESAVKHFFSVASSLDSLVVGEREIITQVRTAFEESSSYKLTGDFIRLMIKSTIETAKRIYTDTPVARNPVSVVSLAYRKLKNMHVKKDARILIVGAGQTNTSMCKYLRKHGFSNFNIFNRSLPNAEILAQMVGGKAHPLDQLYTFGEGFDVLITCTAAANHILNLESYSRLLGNDTGRKIVVDLAIPADVDPIVYKHFSVSAILVETLRQAAEENLALRHNALDQCEVILNEQLMAFRSLYRQRQVELAMKDVPKIVREIREHATTNVFARELNQLDEHSREIVDKMLIYLEKKYISVPMKMAREILLDNKEA
jgi:glutamyl-tRNA reductase